MRQLRRCFSSHSSVLSLAILMLTLAGFWFVADAQDGSSALRGVVEDSSGARIPAALVIVTSPDTGFQRAVFTDSEGNFSFGMLTPGRYDVSATAMAMQ